MIPENVQYLWATTVVKGLPKKPMIILTSGIGKHFPILTKNPSAFVISLTTKTMDVDIEKGTLRVTSKKNFPYLSHSTYPLDVLDGIVPLYCPEAEDNPSKEEFYKWAHEFLGAWLHQRQLIFTGIIEGDKWAKNELENLYLSSCHDILRLNGFALNTDKKREAEVVLVGAGPSIDTQEADIKELSRVHPVICVNSVYRKLRNWGIVPDFCVALDGSENAAKGVRYTETEGSLLICAFQTFPDIPRAFKSVFTFHNSPIIDAFNCDYCNKVAPTNLALGGSVINSAMDLAVFMGFYTVHLFGVDFALGKDGLLISNGTYNEGKKVEEKDWQYVEGNLEEKVPTNRTLLVYLESFNSYMRSLEALNLGVRVLNYSPTGAKISGTLPMLTPAATKFPSRELLNDRLYSLLHKGEEHEADASEFAQRFVDGMKTSLLILKGISGPWFEKLSDPDYEKLACLADSEECEHKAAIRLIEKTYQEVRDYAKEIPVRWAALQQLGLSKYLEIAKRKMLHFKAVHPRWVNYLFYREYLVALHYGVLAALKTLGYTEQQKEEAK